MPSVLHRTDRRALRLGSSYRRIPSGTPRCYPFLEQVRGRSVTEIEIEYAALAHPSEAGHAIFLLRDAEQGVSASRLNDDAGAEASQRRALAALKDRIKQSGLTVASYSNTDRLAELLEGLLVHALTPTAKALRKNLPLDGSLHAAYARDRQRDFQGAQRRIRCLDEWAGSDDAQIFLIEGAAGSGKSALIANWTAHHSATAPGDRITWHYFGCSSESADPQDMMRRIIADFVTTFGEELPERLEGANLIRELGKVLARGGRNAAANPANGF